MAKRKKTPDIMAELLSDVPEAPEPKPVEPAKPVSQPTRKTPKPPATKPPEQPDVRPAETVEKLATPSAEPAEPGGDGVSHFVGFRLEGQRYALPLDRVERALRMVAATPVPEALPWVAGVINLHGRVVPMVDLRQRFGQPSRKPHLDDRLLVVQAQEQTMALMVDEVTEVLEVPANQVEPAPASLSQSRPLAAVIRRDEELILVLNVARLLPSEEDVRRWEQEGLGARVRVPERPTIQETVQMQEDDLTEIRGIGKVYADRLAVGGVRTFGALAEATADEIAALLGLSEGRTPVIQRWIDQATELARQVQAEP